LQLVEATTGPVRDRACGDPTIRARPFLKTINRIENMNPELKSQEPVDIEPNRHFGVVTSVEGNQLCTTGDSGLLHTHLVEPDAKVIGRGKDGKVSDLAVGSRVLITESTDDACVATAVEFLRKPGSASG